MIPSLDYFFSLLSQQINKFHYLFSCKCHERDSKKVNVSKKVRARAFVSSDDDDFVREIAEVVRESYKEMGECCAAVARMIEALECELAEPVTPCDELRRALQACYDSHERQPLDCYKLVTEFTRCAREHALAEH